MSSYNTRTASGSVTLIQALFVPMTLIHHNRFYYTSSFSLTMEVSLSKVEVRLVMDQDWMQAHVVERSAR